MENSTSTEAPSADHESKAVEVSVTTTAGIYPAEGVNHVPAQKLVSEELANAASQLKIHNTDGWIVSIVESSGRRTVDPAKSYHENHLSGRVVLDWGPSEGGGG